MKEISLFYKLKLINLWDSLEPLKPNNIWLVKKKERKYMIGIEEINLCIEVGPRACCRHEGEKWLRFDWREFWRERCQWQWDTNSPCHHLWGTWGQCSTRWLVRFHWRCYLWENSYKVWRKSLLLMRYMAWWFEHSLVQPLAEPLLTQQLWGRETENLPCVVSCGVH